MLEPTDIHCYEPPIYRVCPPSTTEGPPPSLPFLAIVLESANAIGGPSPGLLHSLREQGCQLVLAHSAVPAEDRDTRGLNGQHPQSKDGTKGLNGVRPQSMDGLYQPTALNKEWFDAVFHKVIDMEEEEGEEGVCRIRPLARYLADTGIDPTQVICFACTETGARCFADADVGLVVAAKHDKVWTKEAGTDSVSMPGADLATPECPTARQLAWLHKVVTEKFWCVCLWCSPPLGELSNNLGLPADSPSAADRAELTTVASRTIAARGHPAWIPQRPGNSQHPGCTVLLGNEMMACPDWTLMEAYLRTGSVKRDVRQFGKVTLYSHSLDAGIAQVNHALEVQDTRDGLRVRISDKRIASLATAGEAATELSVAILEGGGKTPAAICIRSSLLLDWLPPGFVVRKYVDIADGHAVLFASFVDKTNSRRIEVTAWHRLVKDDGRGDVQLTPQAAPPKPSSKFEGGVRSYAEAVAGACAVDLIFANPRRGSRYTIEKVVMVTSSVVDISSQNLSSPRDRRPCLFEASFDSEDRPPLLPEVEEAHRSAWRSEWDKADIAIDGTRKVARCQRMARLFRFHQVSRGDSVCAAGEPRVQPLVSRLFQAASTDLFPGENIHRPSLLVTSRLLVQDPRNPPVIRIEPKLPPACRQLRFNAALGQRWHRFTFTPGAVKIHVQGHILHATASQLYGDTVSMPPKFAIPSSEEVSDVVEVRAAPWNQVHVQHSLTELGRPDGSSGGFYSLMRRTRLMRVEVLRRLLGDSEEDFRDATLRQILHNALVGLRSVPRPPEWCHGDNEDLHILEADATTRARVTLSYEKNELIRDISWLEGDFAQVEGQLLAGEVLHVEAMTLAEAKDRCVKLSGCKGFTFQGDAADGPVEVIFKNAWGECRAASDWTTFHFHEGEELLTSMLRKDYETSLQATGWIEEQVPSWDEIITRAETVLTDVANAGKVDGGVGGRPPFRNFITDRDGTTNNYCDRYASSIQSAYNGAWLSHFAHHCTDNAVVVTSAPLGGRPSAEGLLDLSVTPRGVFTYTGSKGREYFSNTAQRLLEAEELPQKQRELMDELHRRLLALCMNAGNTKFLGLGSGLQRKFGEITIARNDPAGTVPEPESRRFMAAVRSVKEALDPDGTELDIHDTGFDLEIFPRAMGGRSFDKGSGVLCLDKKLYLRISEGPNLIAGDTSSDIPLITASLRLMCGDRMVDIWQERILSEEHPEQAVHDRDVEGIAGEGADAELTEEEVQQRLKDEADRRSKEEEEERIAREAASRLAVLFVVSPGLHDHATPDQLRKAKKLGDRVKAWCRHSGAQCALMPSSDALVASLVHYANLVAGRTVTREQLLEQG